MAMNSMRVYFLTCDECEGSPQRSDVCLDGDPTSLPTEAIYVARHNGWEVAEKDPADICPTCVKKRRQVACGLRPNGHTWRKDWLDGTADNDGWIWIDMGPGSVWRRFCLECRLSEQRLDAKESVDAE